MEALPSRLDVAAHIGQKIREEREARFWSLELLAGLAGIGKSTLGQIEIGQNVPQMDTMIRIAGAFGLIVEHFLPDTYLETFSPKVLRAAPDTPNRRSSKSSRKRKAIAVVALAGALTSTHPSRPADAASPTSANDKSTLCSLRKRKAA